MIMVTAIVLMLSITLVVGAGEAVRGQCRRMLSRPPLVPNLGATPSFSVESAEPLAGEAAAA